MGQAVHRRGPIYPAGRCRVWPDHTLISGSCFYSRTRIMTPNICLDPPISDVVHHGGVSSSSSCFTNQPMSKHDEKSGVSNLYGLGIADSPSWTRRHHAPPSPRSRTARLHHKSMLRNHSTQKLSGDIFLIMQTIFSSYYYLPVVFVS
jgi:hypothetical protein